VPNSNIATLPDPDFSWDPNANPPIAGLRPHRAKSYRLEPEILGRKLVVHNELEFARPLRARRLG